MCGMVGGVEKKNTDGALTELNLNGIERSEGPSDGRRQRDRGGEASIFPRSEGELSERAPDVINHRK